MAAIRTNLTQRVVVLPAGTPTLISASAIGRNYLGLMNIGLNPLTLGFDQASIAAGGGWALSPAASAGQQGGSMTFGVYEGAPLNAIYGVSTVGTSIVVLEG